MTYCTHYLLCRPEHYDVKYKINPWMDLSRVPARELAVAQWGKLFAILKSLGVKTELVPHTPGQPDMVFTANAGLVKGKRCVLSKFHHAERQGEEAGFRAWFEANGYEVVEPRKGSFEGEGDALFAKPDLLFSGYGFRTDRSISDELGGLLGVKTIVACELIDPRFYHLDTCFAPLSEEKAIFYPEAFTKDSIARMEREIELVAVPPEDAIRFACNAVVLEKDIVLPAGCAKTEVILQGLGFKTHAVELDEYLKAGGAAKCLSLKI
jgi:N-dimethylarginine dimethylaminohydrolase